MSIGPWKSQVATWSPSGALVGADGGDGLEDAVSASASVSYPYISTAHSVNKQYADGVVLYTCATTNGSNVVNCSDGAFVSSDIGKQFLLYDQNASSLTLLGKLSGTITGVNSPTQITVSTPATRTIASADGRLVYGTDRAAYVQSVLDAAGSRGGFVMLPVGVLVCSSKLIVPGGVTLAGHGCDEPSNREFINRGSCLIRSGAYAASEGFVQMGRTADLTSMVSGRVSPRIVGVGIDGGERADYAVHVYGRRARIDSCTIQRGTSVALHASNGPDASITDNSIQQMNLGTVFYGGGDLHLCRNRIHGAGNGGHNVHLKNTSDSLVAHNHFWKGGFGTSSYATLLGNNVLVEMNGYDSDHQCVVIDSNVFDGTAGAHIKGLFGSAGGKVFRGFSITNNTAFQNSLPDSTYPAIDITVSSGYTLSGLVVANNSVTATLYGADANKYTALIAATNAGTISGAIVAHNFISHAVAGITGTLTPAVGAGTNVLTSGTDVASAF